MSSHRDRDLGAASAPGDSDELALFHRTLAELCRSRIPLPTAFRVLEADLEGGRLKEAVGAMAESVEQGTPLVEAYAARRDVFPPTYRALVEAGTASGDLAGTLDEIALHAARRADAESRVKRALAYPLLSGLLILGVGAVAIALAVPRLWGFAESVSGRTAAPVAFGALGVLAFLVLAGTWWTLKRSPHQGAWTYALPVLGPIRLDALRSTVSATLSMLLRRELSLPAALGLAADTADHPVWRARLADARQRTEEGSTLSEALESAGLFESSRLWLVRSAEANGDAAGALHDVARLYRRRLDRRLDRFTLLVRPAAELTLGVVVFCFAFSFLVPLFDYTTRILHFGG